MPNVLCHEESERTFNDGPYESYRLSESAGLAHVFTIQKKYYTCSVSMNILIRTLYNILDLKRRGDMNEHAVQISCSYI